MVGIIAGYAAQIVVLAAKWQDFACRADFRPDILERLLLSLRPLSRFDVRCYHASRASMGALGS
jgi:hypothetical protein